MFRARRLSADDPGLHSSQNEQDNRYYGLAAKVPVLCPSDSQEAKDLTKLAFEISEEFDIPVMVRITTRIAHSRTVVELAELPAMFEIPLESSPQSSTDTQPNSKGE